MQKSQLKIKKRLLIEAATAYMFWQNCENSISMCFTLQMNCISYFVIIKHTYIYIFYHSVKIRKCNGFKCNKT